MRHVKKQKIVSSTTEVVPERDPRADILGKDFKTTILKMLEELRENVGKVKKVTYEQSGNVHTDRKPKR